MSRLEKRIFQTWSDLNAYLTAKGFTIANNQIQWSEVPVATNCYWSVTNTGTINFIDSAGNQAFYHNLSDFDNGKYCACIFIPLQDNGCILYLSPVNTDYDITNLTICCTNNYTYDAGEDTYVDGSNDLENGVVIITPAEQDGYWRYTWRSEDPTTFKWCIDNTQDIVTEGTEIPYAQIIQANLTVTLLKAYLANGFWSKYIYTQVLGQIDPPGNIFKINGQKFISITDNTTYRAPVFKLEAENIIINPSTSTEQYSVDKTYKVGDYCIYEGLLWKCRQAVTIPGPFDQTNWVITTVHDEIVSS